MVRAFGNYVYSVGILFGNYGYGNFLFRSESSCGNGNYPYVAAESVLFFYYGRRISAQYPVFGISVGSVCVESPGNVAFQGNLTETVTEIGGNDKDVFFVRVGFISFRRKTEVFSLRNAYFVAAFKTAVGFFRALNTNGNVGGHIGYVNNVRRGVVVNGLFFSVYKYCGNSVSVVHGDGYRNIVVVSESQFDGIIQKNAVCVNVARSGIVVYQHDVVSNFFEYKLHRFIFGYSVELEAVRIGGIYEVDGYGFAAVYSVCGNVIPCFRRSNQSTCSVERNGGRRYLDRSFVRCRRSYFVRNFIEIET